MTSGRDPIAALVSTGQQLTELATVLDLSKVWKGPRNDMHGSGSRDSLSMGLLQLRLGLSEWCCERCFGTLGVLDELAA